MTALKNVLNKYNIRLFYDIFTKKYIIVELNAKDIDKVNKFTYKKDFIQNLDFKLNILTDGNVAEYNDKAVLGSCEYINSESYLPSKDLVVIQGSNKTLNTNFPKPSLNKLQISDFKEYEGKFPTILKIMNNLFENDKKSLIWGLNWFSNLLKFNYGMTDEKVETSILFYGIQGSGKNFFINGIIEMFIKTRELTQNDLESPNNGYLIESNLITFNEIEVKKNNRVMDEVKNMLTCVNHYVNIKNIPQFPIPNIHNYIFTSNKSIPLIIEQDDRRFTILKPVSKIKSLISMDVIREFDKCFKGKLTSGKYYDEIINFGNYLLNFPVDFDLISNPLENETKTRLMTKALSLNQKFIEELKTKDFLEFCEEHSLKYQKYFTGYKDGQYYTQKNKIYQLYEDYFKLMSNKEEYIKRKDQILEELHEAGIFIPQGKVNLRLNLIDEDGSEMFRYAYLYGKRNELYLNEQDLNPEIIIPEMEELN